MDRENIKFYLAHFNSEYSVEEKLHKLHANRNFPLFRLALAGAVIYAPSSATVLHLSLLR